VHRDATKSLVDCRYDDQFEQIFVSETIESFAPMGIEFEHCMFRGISIESLKATNCTLIDCVFEECGLALCEWTGTSLRGCVFRGSKLSGSNWTTAAWNAFSSASPLSFEQCDLSHSSFQGIRMAKTVFRNCNLTDVDFSDSDLTGVELDGCELERANFSRANLTKADLRSALNYVIDPTSCVLDGTRFLRTNLEGLVTTFGLIVE
jgi:fluoroquinolone resistance protein